MTYWQGTPMARRRYRGPPPGEDPATLAALGIVGTPIGPSAAQPVEPSFGYQPHVIGTGQFTPTITPSGGGQSTILQSPIQPGTNLAGMMGGLPPPVTSPVLLWLLSLLPVL